VFSLACFLKPIDSGTGKVVGNPVSLTSSTHSVKTPYTITWKNALAQVSIQTHGVLKWSHAYNDELVLVLTRTRGLFLTSKLSLDPSPVTVQTRFVLTASVSNNLPHPYVVDIDLSAENDSDSWDILPLENHISLGYLSLKLAFLSLIEQSYPSRRNLSIFI
jgi:hypothetical protein